MKKNSSSPFAIALVVLLTAMACNRVPDNPNYSIADNSVLAKLVLNISTSNGKDSSNGQTKMTADAVQIDGTFRGMDAVHIIPYKLEGKDHLYVGANEDITSNYFKAIGDINLGTLIGSTASASATRVVEVKIPLGTDVMALYAKASKTPGADDAEGVVDLSYSPATSVDCTPNTILFKLADRLTVDGETDFDEFALLVGTMLEGFFRTGLAPETQELGYKTNTDYTYAFWYPVDEVSDAYPTRTNGSTTKIGGGTPYSGSNIPEHPGYTYYTGTKYWREYGRQYARNHNYIAEGEVQEMKPLEEVLGQAYAEFCTIKQANDGSKELRAGSSSAIIRTIADMALIIDKVANAIPTCPEEEVAKLLAEELQNRILRYFSVSQTDNVYNWSTLSFKKWNNLKTIIDAYYPNATTGGQSVSEALFPHITDAFFNAETGFPINLHMPRGASILTIGSRTVGGLTVDTFTYLKQIPAYGMGSLDFKLPIINYRYPPELMYFCNSPLRLSTKNDNVTFPASKEAWDQSGSWDSSTWSAVGDAVTSTTRSAAIVKHVNYGNALLQSNVKYDNDATGGLHDNNSVLHPGEDDNVIAFTDAGALEVTGILIGGQPDFVGWDFTAAPASSVNGKVVHGTAVTTNAFDKLIYDKTTPFNVPASGNSNTMYTLCWDNFDITKVPTGNETAAELEEKKQSTVYIALELVNNTGRDFWGELNLVRKGGTFYLVGALNPNANSGVSGTPESLARDNYFYPPYKSDGTTYNIPRVFMQDYVTKATLVLGQYSLRHAYVTVPDLRGSQVSLGLSVDVTWETGLNFTDVLMGGGDNTSNNSGN